MENRATQVCVSLASLRDRLSVTLATALAEIARLKHENELLRAFSDPHDTNRESLLQVANVVRHATLSRTLDSSFDRGVAAGRLFAIEQIEAAAEQSGRFRALDENDQLLPRDEEFVKGVAVGVAILLRRAEVTLAKEIWDSLGLDTVPKCVEAFDAEPIKLAIGTAWNAKVKNGDIS